VVWLVSEKERCEMKLQRLFDRTEKVWEELMKSKLSSREKTELYDSFISYTTGFMVHLEE
jgi:hypothetical protein